MLKTACLKVGCFLHVPEIGVTFFLFILLSVNCEGRFVMCGVATKSDSEVIFSVQMLSKT